MKLHFKPALTRLTYFLTDGLIGHVPVYVKVLDVNDNAPAFDMPYEAFVCENAKVGQVKCKRRLHTNLHLLLKN